MNLPNTGDCHLILASGEFKPETYLEVGVNNGFSVAALLSVHHPKHMILCDDWCASYGGVGTNSHEFAQSILEKHKYTGKVTWLDGDSKRLLPTLNDAIADVAFVDADHTFNGALIDIFHALRILKMGGCLLVDDLCHPNHRHLERLFDTFLSLTRTELVHKVVGDNTLGMGVLRKL